MPSPTRSSTIYTLTIADGETTSAAFDTAEFSQAIAVRGRTGVEGSAIKFSGAESYAGTYSLVAIDGTDISISLTANKWDAPLEQEMKALLAIPFLKIVVGTAQTGTGTFDVVLK